MNGEFLNSATVLIYGTSLMVFAGCVAVSLIRGRFGMRALLLAITAACVVMAILASSWALAELPD